MPYTPPATVVTGTTIATAWGNSLKAALDFLANPPACRVTKAAAQSMGNGAFTVIPFDTERFDNDTMHDNAVNNSRITIKTAGVYVVTGHVDWAANTAGRRILQLYVNNATEMATVQQIPNAGGGECSQIVTAIWKFAVNDYVELRGYQNSGGALNAAKSGAFAPELSAAWVGLG